MIKTIINHVLSSYLSNVFSSFLGRKETEDGQETNPVKSDQRQKDSQKPNMDSFKRNATLMEFTTSKLISMLLEKLFEQLKFKLSIFKWTAVIGIMVMLAVLWTFVKWSKKSSPNVWFTLIYSPIKWLTGTKPHYPLPDNQYQDPLIEFAARKQLPNENISEEYTTSKSSRNCVNHLLSKSKRLVHNMHSSQAFEQRFHKQQRERKTEQKTTIKACFNHYFNSDKGSNSSSKEANRRKQFMYNKRMSSQPVFQPKLPIFYENQAQDSLEDTNQMPTHDSKLFVTDHMKWYNITDTILISQNTRENSNQHGSLQGDCLINEQQVTYTIDSGADVTVISENVYISFKKPLPLEPIKNIIASAGGGGLDIVGQTYSQIKIDEYAIFSFLIVVKNLVVDCLLDMDLIPQFPFFKQPIDQVRDVIGQMNHKLYQVPKYFSKNAHINT
ncbi:hypothetical protein BpHYR1_038635 [Brachionus plicatilis]|uniref:Peptidase A2 domain-containing protein n=1 Tax=Brachionus plicatilis TaxID=10195 RepID=A0A3M7QND4_BRAPC|nr:hypothetical protein BpHYR1_038635 [Brachionus plicatilis]